jgi:plastocyanin
MKPKLRILLDATLLSGLLTLGPGPAVAATVQVQVVGSQGKPLALAAVFLESREARQLVKPLAGAEIAQVNKVFDPSVLVVPVGTSVQFPNRDTVRHHVYSFSPAKTFELKLYTGTAANPVVFDKTGIAILGCNIHDNMTAWVVVVDTPYYGRTAKAGTVVLNNVPAGRYQLRVWHPDLAVGTAAADEALVVGSVDSTTTFHLSDVKQ